MRKQVFAVAARRLGQTPRQFFSGPWSLQPDLCSLLFYEGNHGV